MRSHCPLLVASITARAPSRDRATEQEELTSVIDLSVGLNPAVLDREFGPKWAGADNRSSTLPPVHVGHSPRPSKGAGSLSARRCYPKHMTTQIVGTDGSDLAIEAAAAGLAILTPCDRVLVVSVTDGPDPSLADDATGHASASLTPAEFDEQNRAARDRSRLAVEATVAALRERGVLPESIELLTIEGEPGPALCNLAQEQGASAIVVGSRGRGGIKRAFLGSVSDYVARNALCPVVITR
jgi:nucleotide-binding universal stress UspA family protein